MKSKFKSQFLVVAAVIFTVVYLGYSLFIFGKSTNGLIESSTQMYLTETANAVAAAFRTKLEDQLVMLESQVRYFNETDMSDYNAVKDTILATKGIGAFKNIGVADAAGRTITYNGKSAGNILLTDYFREAMTGKNAISHNVIIDEDKDEVLALAVPIRHDSGIVGAVYGTFTKDTINTLVDTTSFAESGFNILSDENGHMIARSGGDSYIDSSANDIYKVIGVTKDIKEETVVKFRLGKTDMLAVIVPVGVHGWNFITILPDSVISDLSNTISRYLIYVVFAVSVSFTILAYSIFTLIKRMRRMTIDKEKLGAELGVASRIQAHMLPTDFPEEKTFALFATMDPAKEVGGDFYDFFYIDDDHLALVMADVAGKGVPASLFMVITKTMIKDRVFVGGSPAEILEDVNNRLCENNALGLFVTVWLGILTISTGELISVNAGHEYPAIKRKDGSYTVLEGVNDPPVAAMEDMQYDELTLTLNPGDSLFLYTDGVPEAKSSDGKRFGLDAMVEALDEGSELSAAETVMLVKHKIDAFAGKGDPFDDITMMCLNYFGK